MDHADMAQLVGAAALYKDGEADERYKMLAGLKWLVAECERMDEEGSHG